MFGKSTIVAVLSALSLVAAQSTTASGAAPSATGNVLVHVIQVGNANGTLKFTPEVTNAAIGDKIQFQFYPKNHSVAQSSFDAPCNPLAQSATSNGGFWSGFMPVTAQDTSMPVFTIDINATTPIWFYCATGKHCQSGMVGVINPPANNAARTIDTYRAGAAKAVANVAPSGGSTSPTDSTPSTPSGTNPVSTTGASSGASALATSMFGLLGAALVSLTML